MEKLYYIEGMTCEGCVKTVTEKILSHNQVASAEVDLVKGQAIVNSTKALSVNEIQELIGLKYSVSEEKNHSNAKQMHRSKLKSLFPLFLIFGYLIIGTFYLQYISSGSSNEIMYRFMGLFFVVFSFFKFLDYKGFAPSFARYDPLAQKSNGYAKAYPFIEAGLGVAYLLEWNILMVLIFTIVLLSITTFGVIKALMQKNQIECACLGTALKLPMTEATLIENAVMIVMGCVLLTGYWI